MLILILTQIYLDGYTSNLHMYLLTHLFLLITGQNSINSITLRVLGEFRNRMTLEIGPLPCASFYYQLSTFWSPIYSVIQNSLYHPQTYPLNFPHKMAFIILAVMPLAKLLCGPSPFLTQNFFLLSFLDTMTNL